MQIMGYEPKPILLLHGNWLEADHIRELADLIQKRGHRFITLENALRDQASQPARHVYRRRRNQIARPLGNHAG